MINLNLKLPANFLEDEIRCDYNVTQDIKKVWAVELDLLSALLRVCEKHSIKIFAYDGTMLGAVRHRGFIPWDNDIDMALLRDDYEKLCEIGLEEFKFPYFFQTEYTDKGCLRGHAQLRNSLTTGILKSELDGNFRFNQGIFIDIFPLDSIIDDNRLLMKQKKLYLKYKRKFGFISSLTNRYIASPNKIKGYIKLVLKFLCEIVKLDYKTYYVEWEKVCSMYNGTDTSKIGSISLRFEDKVFDLRSDYDEVIYLDFEFLQIPVPANFDNILRTRYGDYNIFKKGESFHGEIIFDVDNPYKNYLESEVK